MLDTLDLLIGFIVVMLTLSMVVTMLTQFVTTTVLNLRGTMLRQGLARLLALLDGGLTHRDALGVADRVLRHVLVGEPWLTGSRMRLASAIQRDELVRLLLDFAGHGDAARADEALRGSEPDWLRHRLRRSLRDNGVPDPLGTLDAVRAATLELAAERPELPQAARAELALARHAASRFLAKIMMWFDDTIARTADAFTLRARVISTALGVLLVLVLQVNTFELMNRLAADDEARRQLVEAVIDEPERFAPRSGTPQEALERLRDDPAVGALVATDLIRVPRDWSDWLAYWDADEILVQALGLLVSIALVSLGAPVWYEALKNLIHMRSLVARRYDEQRAGAGG